MRKIFLLTSLIIIITTLTSCNLFTSPEELEPERRDYVWTADTLKNQRVLLHRIWGSSPDDVWANGSGSSRVNLWHYGGYEWKTDSVQRRITPWGIWGSSNNNVWLGTARNNIYGVGFAGKYNEDDYTNIIVRYKTYNWEIVPLPKNRIILNSCAIQESTGLLFISGTNYEDVWTEKLLVFNGSDLAELYSGSSVMAVYNIKGEVYFTKNQDIYKFNQGRLDMWENFNGTRFVGFLWGVNEKDIFYKAVDGIGHYNGVDHETLHQTDLDITDGFRFEKDIFVIAYDWNGGNNVIIHGRLNE